MTKDKYDTPEEYESDIDYVCDYYGSESVSLQQYFYYKPDDLQDLFKRLLDEAKAKGLEGCYLQFKSCWEPWEDYLGNPEVIACGFRKKNKRELGAEAEYKCIQDKANSLGITHYEAEKLLEAEEILNRLGI